MLAATGSSQFANAQDFVWAKQMGGSDNEIGNSIKVDASGNVYTIGNFEGIVDFDPGAGISNLTSSGMNDIFILKLDVLGNFIWAKNIGGSGDDFGSSINLDALGNLYSIGYFEMTVDFNPNTGNFNLTSSGFRDIFILKLDSLGNFIWAKQMGGIGFDGANSIALDSTGNIFTTGYFGETSDFDPGAGIFNLTSAGNTDIFISKLDVSGNFLWAKRLSGAGFESGISLKLDDSSNVFTTGFFDLTIDFDPGLGTFNLSSLGSSDIFILKLDADGNFVWAKQIGGIGADGGRSVGLDELGNVYTSGIFNESVDFKPGLGDFNLTSSGELDTYISKLDAAGNFVWAKKIGGISIDRINSIELDASGNIYTTGFFKGISDFDPGIGTFNLTSIGGRDQFISKLDAEGNFVWAINLGGTSDDEGKSIGLDNFGNVYTTGYFTETSDFNPQLGVFNLISAGGDDIFISKLSNGTVGLYDNFKNTNISIYPNPTKNQINFSVETNVQLNNIAGQLIVEKNNVSMLDLSEQAAGLYFITLTDKKGKVIKRSKIVKE